MMANLVDIYVFVHIGSESGPGERLKASPASVVLTWRDGPVRVVWRSSRSHLAGFLQFAKFGFSLAQARATTSTFAFASDSQ